MYILVDTRQVPPTVSLCDPDDFTSFRVVVETSPHVWVDPQEVTALAGRADDAWTQKLAGMVAYASSKAWVDEQGRVRAHVEVAENR